MSKLMKAAVTTAAGQPLEIRDLPVPGPGAGEVLVRIDVCGLCHTDLHFWKGDHPIPREHPVILGHEGIGTIVELGSGVTRLKTGERVGTGYVHGTCGNCKECLTGHETHCAEVECTGVDADGCFAEYAVFQERWATPIPERLEAAQAAPLLCAGVAAYSAVRKARLEPGELAVVFGAGGLGTYAIQIAGNHTRVLRWLTSPTRSSITADAWVPTTRSVPMTKCRARFKRSAVQTPASTSLRLPQAGARWSRRQRRVRAWC